MSKRFRFALEPVLEHRKRIEAERQKDLAGALLALEEAYQSLRALHEGFRKHSTILRDDHTSFDVERLRLHYAHLEFLDRAIVVAEGVVTQRKAEVEKARHCLLDAAKEKKALEKLKGRRQDAHALAQTRAEQKEMDDNNARRYARSSAGGSLL